ncbi:MAG TPA: GDP-mannose 4,6-dehydratase, partial [Bacteroidia bacterium]|nr:GDP-mannose 4,6-dehydratase [Bacteroidia bacterium]
AFVRTNVHGTWQLLESARIHFRSLPETRERDRFRFLHVSTDEVFGALAPGAPKFTEESPCAPNSPYAASKAAADHFVRTYWRTYGLPTLTAHASNNYGPRQFPEKLIPLMIAKILRGEPLPIYGDGLQTRDWLHVEDCCRALWRMLLEGLVGESYNIGGGAELTNLAMVHRLVDLVNAQLPEGSRLTADQRIRHVGDRPGHDLRYAVDSGKIERELGWKPLETIDSGLRKMVEWYLDHTEWLDRSLSGDYRGERLGAGTDATATRDRVG